MESKEQMLMQRRREFQAMIDQSHKLGSCQAVTMMDMAQMFSDAVDAQEASKRRLLLTL